MQDGNYFKRNAKIEKKLKAWSNKIIKDNLWDKFIDIHLDELDICLKDKDKWIHESIYIFKNLFNFIDRTVYQVLLVIPLSFNYNKSDFNIESLNDLSKFLDFTPPSFYLFKLGDKNLSNTLKNVTLMEHISNLEDLNIYFKEIKENNEYDRTIYMLNYM